MKFELVLFDLGNTLIYFDGDEGETAAQGNQELTRELIRRGYALHPVEFPLRFQAALQAYFDRREKDGLELTSAYVLREELFVAGFPHPSAEDLRAALKAMYAVSEAHWKIGDDTYATLDLLKKSGYRLGIISNAADADDFHRLVRRHHLESYFELTLVSAEVGMRKPHPLIFQLALDFYQVPPQGAAMVGDLPAMDVVGARGIGIAGIWITRWLQPGAGKAPPAGIRPDACINSLSELPGILSNWKERPFCA